MMDIIIFKGKGKKIELKVNLDKETVWLTQKQIAQVFETQRPAITKHLNNIFNAKELDENSVSSILEHTAKDGKRYLYSSIEEQAAHLLYFVIKNHSFNDGNKRIGAFLFIWFLEKNKHRFKPTGELKINDNGLTAIALLVAQSQPEEKELMIQLIVNLIADA